MYLFIYYAQFVFLCFTFKPVCFVFLTNYIPLAVFICDGSAFVNQCHFQFVKGIFCNLVVRVLNFFCPLLCTSLSSWWVVFPKLYMDYLKNLSSSIYVELVQVLILLTIIFRVATCPWMSLKVFEIFSIFQGSGKSLKMDLALEFSEFSTVKGPRKCSNLKIANNSRYVKNCERQYYLLTWYCRSCVTCWKRRWNRFVKTSRECLKVVEKYLILFVQKQWPPCSVY